jgi:putrescine---pyruvate transaminase
MTRYWHPFADMATVAVQGELVITRGEGAHVWDRDGRRYLDAAGGLWYCNVGYGRDELASAAAEQLRIMSAYSNFGDFATQPTLDLADRLSTLAPVPESVAFFTSNGSDAVDSAIKLCRRYWQVIGHPERTAIVVREGAYHGMHVGGTGLAGISANRAGYEGMLPDVLTAPAFLPDDLAASIDGIGAEHVAAFFCEPVLGAGGVFPPPPGYLKAVQDICRQRGILFVLDEVITGMGRLGAWFAGVRYGLSPDLLLCAKGLTSGYVPMGAMVVSPRVAEPFWTSPGAIMWRHGYTYSGHATAAAVALSNLSILEREQLLPRALELEELLATALAPLSAHALVSEVRSGTGVLAAVQIDTEVQAERPDLPARVVQELRRLGVLTRTLTGGSIQISPALVITDADIQLLVNSLGAALDAAARADALL